MINYLHAFFLCAVIFVHIGLVSTDTNTTPTIEVTSVQKPILKAFSDSSADNISLTQAIVITYKQIEQKITEELHRTSINFNSLEELMDFGLLAIKQNNIHKNNELKNLAHSVIKATLIVLDQKTSPLQKKPFHYFSVIDQFSKYLENNLELQIKKLTALQHHINVLEPTEINYSIETFFSTLDETIELTNQASTLILKSWHTLFSNTAKKPINEKTIEKIVYQLLWYMSSWIQKRDFTKSNLAHDLFKALTQIPVYKNSPNYAIITAAQPIFHALKNNPHDHQYFKSESFKATPHLDYFIRYWNDCTYSPTKDFKTRLSELANCINSKKFLHISHENEIKILFVTLYNHWRGTIFFEDFINKKNSEHWINWFLKIATCCLECSKDVSPLCNLKTSAQTDILALQLISQKSPDNWENIVTNLMNHTIPILENEEEKDLEIRHYRTIFEYYMIAADFLAKKMADYTKNVHLKTIDNVDTFNHTTGIFHHSLRVFEFFERISKNSTTYLHTSYWTTIVLPRLWENISIAQFESARKLLLFTQTAPIKNWENIYSKIFYQLEYILLPLPDIIQFVEQTEEQKHIVISTIVLLIKFYETRNNQPFSDFYYNYFITYAEENTIFTKEDPRLIEPFNMIVEYFWKTAAISLKPSYTTPAIINEAATIFLDQWINFVKNASDFFVKKNNHALMLNILYDLITKTSKNPLEDFKKLCFYTQEEYVKSNGSSCHFSLSHASKTYGQLCQENIAAQSQLSTIGNTIGLAYSQASNSHTINWQTHAKSLLLLEKTALLYKDHHILSLLPDFYTHYFQRKDICIPEFEQIPLESSLVTKETKASRLSACIESSLKKNPIDFSLVTLMLQKIKELATYSAAYSNITEKIMEKLIESHMISHISLEKLCEYAEVFSELSLRKTIFFTTLFKQYFTHIYKKASLSNTEAHKLINTLLHHTPHKENKRAYERFCTYYTHLIELTWQKDGTPPSSKKKTEKLLALLIFFKNCDKNMQDFITERITTLYNELKSLWFTKDKPSSKEMIWFYYNLSTQEATHVSFEIYKEILKNLAWHEDFIASYLDLLSRTEPNAQPIIKTTIEKFLTSSGISKEILEEVLEYLPTDHKELRAKILLKIAKMNGYFAFDDEFIKQLLLHCNFLFVAQRISDFLQPQLGLEDPQTAHIKLFDKIVIFHHGGHISKEEALCLLNFFEKNNPKLFPEKINIAIYRKKIEQETTKSYTTTSSNLIITEDPCDQIEEAQDLCSWTYAQKQLQRMLLSTYYESSAQ